MTATDHQPPDVLAGARIAYRVAEVAQLCGVTKPTVYSWLDDGSLPSAKINGVRLVRAVDLRDFLAAAVERELSGEAG